MKLQILIPQYKETEEIIKPLLDSIEIQQRVDLKNDVEVIIVNDGTDIFLSDNFLNNYSYSIKYYINKEHKGVSATRNLCLEKATADYIMFCDADDMFYNSCGLWIIFREIEQGFDSLASTFIEEGFDSTLNTFFYIDHNNDSTFVHGKVYRRKFLEEKNIKWNNNLTIHEDLYFNYLSQTLADNAKYLPTSFYLWRYRENSVCRHDPKYHLRTYNNFLDTKNALIEEFLKRGRNLDAEAVLINMIYDAYFTMNMDDWLNQENKEFRIKTELRFKNYWFKYKDLHDKISLETKNKIIIDLKSSKFQQGLVLEKQTFESWINQIENNM